MEFLNRLAKTIVSLTSAVSLFFSFLVRSIWDRIKKSATFALNAYRNVRDFCLKLILRTLRFFVEIWKLYLLVLVFAGIVWLVFRFSNLTGAIFAVVTICAFCFIAWLSFEENEEVEAVNIRAWDTLASKLVARKIFDFLVASLIAFASFCPNSPLPKPVHIHFIEKFLSDHKLTDLQERYAGKWTSNEPIKMEGEDWRSAEKKLLSGYVLTLEETTSRRGEGRIELCVFEEWDNCVETDVSYSLDLLTGEAILEFADSASHSDLQSPVAHGELVLNQEGDLNHQGRSLSASLQKTTQEHQASSLVIGVNSDAVMDSGKPEVVNSNKLEGDEGDLLLRRLILLVILTIIFIAVVFSLVTIFTHKSSRKSFNTLTIKKSNSKHQHENLSTNSTKWVFVKTLTTWTNMTGNGPGLYQARAKLSQKLIDASVKQGGADLWYHLRDVHLMVDSSGQFSMGQLKASLILNSIDEHAKSTEGTIKYWVVKNTNNEYWVQRNRFKPKFWPDADQIRWSLDL